MRTLMIVLICVVCFVFGTAAQSVDYKKIILPDDALDITFEERLVQLAWKNNPSSHIAAEELLISREEFKIKRSEWASLAGVSGNLNEFNVKAITNPNDNGGNLFFPRYNFFIRLPLSLLVENPHQKVAAKAKVRVSENKQNLLKLEIRKTVLKLYSEYKKAELIKNIRQESMADEESNYLLIEQKFKNGDALIEDYIKAQKSRNESKIQVAQAENDFLKAKYDLEEIIGVRIEDVK